MRFLPDKNIPYPMQTAIIVGATSGIGRETARQLALRGWRVGVAGRREAALRELQAEFPQQTEHAVIDVTQEDAPERLLALIRRTDGMDLFLLCSGIGYHNMELDADWEISTAQTNACGFVRMVTAAFRYFAEQPEGGHIAAITSIAGTKPLGAAPAYSATKRFQNAYLDALDQQARMRHLPIRFTDLRPGFVRTELLAGKNYPMLMTTEHTARRIVRALLRHERTVTIDWRYALLVGFWRLLPRWLWLRLRVQ